MFFLPSSRSSRQHNASEVSRGQLWWWVGAKPTAATPRSLFSDLHAHFVSLDPGWGWAGNSKEGKDPSEAEAYKFSNQYVQETNFSISLDGEALTGTWIEPFSWEPRAFVLHNILSDEECTHMISLAQPDVEASTVITNSAKHESGVSQVRTSFGTFLRRYHDEAVGKIEEMVSSIPTFSLHLLSAPSLDPFCECHSF